MRGRAMLVSVLALGALTIPVEGVTADGTPSPTMFAASGIPDSRELRTPEIVTGHLEDSSGSATAGMVAAYAWPTNMPLSVGDAVRLVPVAWTSVGSDGGFVLRSAGTTALGRLAAANGGYVNFSLEADAGAGQHTQTHFSRYLGSGQTPFVVDGAWRERPELAGSPVELRFERDVTPMAVSDPRPLHPCWADYYVDETEPAPTVVGELNPEQDTVFASFTYGEGNQADSDIGIGVKSRDGQWGIGGSHHIANSDQGRTVKKARPNERLLIYNNFDYHLYKSRCGSGERIIPHGWRGGVSSVMHLTPDCDNRQYRDRYENNSEFHRDRNRAGTWEGAVEIFGASLSARSGYSRQVQVRMHFGERPVHWVCGDNDHAMRSNRVWTGINVEGPPCQPGRPC